MTEVEVLHGEELPPDGGSPPLLIPPSFDQVYADHFDFVWRSIRRLGIPEASVDDALQEVFIVVHRRLSEFEGRAVITTWLFRIILHTVGHHRRSMSRKRAFHADRESPDDLPSEAATDPYENTVQAQELRLLYTLLDRLDDDKRAVFVLAELEQMTAPEIAESIGIKLNTVYSRLRAARASFEEEAAKLLGVEWQGQGKP